MFVETSVGKVFCRISGNGPAVMLVHGFGCSGVQWTYTMPALAKAGFTAIAVDLPGFGSSDLPPKAIPSSHYGVILSEVIDKLSLNQVTLIGNSMGAFASWLCAVNHPDRVKALVLTNSAGAPMKGTLPARSKRRRPLGAVLFPGLSAIAGLQISNPLTKRIVRPIVLKSFGDPERITPEIFELLHQAAKKSRIVLAKRLTWANIPEPHELLNKIKCPTLIVWGDKDQIVPISAMDFFMDNIPHARLKVYFGVGHIPMLEIPEEFNKDLLDFLAIA